MSHLETRHINETGEYPIVERPCYYKTEYVRRLEKLVEQNSDSSALPVQQLKAEIRKPTWRGILKGTMILLKVEIIVLNNQHTIGFLNIQPFSGTLYAITGEPIYRSATK